MNKPSNQPFETTLQDLVYSLDAGAGLKLVRVLLFCLIAVGVIVVFTARQFHGFDSEASMDSAQLGRNLAEMNRYVTHTVRPVTMAQVAADSFDGNAQVGFHPELIRPPAYPAVLAGAFKFFKLIGVDLFPSSTAFKGMRIYPAEQWVIVPINHFFAMLTGLMLYLLGRTLFSHRLGLIGVITYFLSFMVWQDSLYGAGLSLLSFFVLSAFYFAVRAMESRRNREPASKWVPHFVGSALFGAAAFLTHYSFLAVLPGILLFILISGSRTQRSGHLAFFYLLLVLVGVSPWLLRNYQLCGMPLGLAPHLALADTAAYPGDALVRSLHPQFNLLADWSAVRAKWSTQFSELYATGRLVLGGGLLMAFFIAAYFYRFVRVSVHKLRWGIGLSMVLFLVGAGCFGAESLRVYHIFWPFVILYGLAFFTIQLDRLDLPFQLYRTGLTGFVVALSALPLFLTIFVAPLPKPSYPPYYVPFVMRVCELLRPAEVICSDMPWATAWYGRRVSILLPQTLDDYYEINDYRKYISGLYLTTLTKDRPMVSGLLSGPEKSWVPILMGHLSDEFPLHHGFQLNDQDQLFLTDSVRWGGEAVQAHGAAGTEPAKPAENSTGE